LADFGRPHPGRRRRRPGGPSACVRASARAWSASFQFALPAADRTFRLNIAWMDHDRPENTKPSVLWWRDPAVAEFGVF